MQIDTEGNIKMDDEIQMEPQISYAFEYNWGYLKWAKCDNKIYEKIFPEGKFDVVFDGILIKNRKVNWEGAKLGLTKVKNKLKLGTTLLIRRKGNLVIIDIKNKS